MHKPYLVDVESVSLGANGTLDCKQTNGSVCTEQQISAIVDFTMSSSFPRGKSQLRSSQGHEVILSGSSR